MRLWQPRVSTLEFVRDLLWRRGIGKDDPLDRVENVDEQGSVHRRSEVERERHCLPGCRLVLVVLQQRALAQHSTLARCCKPVTRS
jgi:hypothetical protein